MSQADRVDHPLFNQFEQWFVSLLRTSGSCVLRNTLKDSKELLWDHFLKNNPVEQPLG